jgi:predicted TPR repeat methyltransferase
LEIMPNHPADQIIAIYERHAYAWDSDRNSVGWNDRPWHTRFIEWVAPGASILDLGCGSGAPVARNLVQHGFRVTGVDTSPSLVSLCRSRMPEQEWIVSDMRTVALGRRFDGILAWDSFFFLRHEDQRHMFDVFARHAATPCILMFNAGPAHGEAMGEYRGEPLYHASLDGTEYRTLLARAGFEVIAHVVQAPDAGDRTPWLARSRAR